MRRKMIINIFDYELAMFKAMLSVIPSEDYIVDYEEICNSWKIELIIRNSNPNFNIIKRAFQNSYVIEG